MKRGLKPLARCVSGIWLHYVCSAKVRGVLPITFASAHNRRQKISPFGLIPIFRSRGEPLHLFPGYPSSPGRPRSRDRDGLAIHTPFYPAICLYSSTVSGSVQGCFLRPVTFATVWPNICIFERLNVQTFKNTKHPALGTQSPLAPPLHPVYV
jgi:hypothetical protein